MPFDEALLADASKESRPHLTVELPEDFMKSVGWLAGAAKGNARLIQRLAAQTLFLREEIESLRHQVEELRKG